MRTRLSIIVWSIAVTAACGGGGGSSPTSPSTSTSTSTGSTGGTGGGSTATVTWAFGGSSWTASGTAPSCPSPLTFTLPVDVSKVTAVLYPGQTRGGNYKAHGGFRFADGTNTAITVTAPMSALSSQQPSTLERS